ncbi:hypothetical protein SBOR_5850 [Sclerotinia borealis F-4128]|uniref:BTB domain-containing protein n=1 Tax=Sclerotinia borealis (strain F-4128) TaxID=1432307 RepID=W9CAF6_SCLBF|nr:hypothetical protein SBOR_5850 [Sclerotinia borealis F-4128]
MEDMPPPPPPPPPRKATSRVSTPVLKVSRLITESEYALGAASRAHCAAVKANVDGKKASRAPDIDASSNVDIDATEATNAGADETSGKRMANGVDMRPFKKKRLLGSLTEMVKLLVGSEARPETILVHKNLLCAASPFFEAACKPEWQVDEECVIVLPEDKPKLIKLLVYWIYNHEIVYLASWKSLELTRALINTYILAEKYQMPQLQNDIIDAMVYEIVEMGNYIFSPDSTMIYDNTLPSSKLRLLAVNFGLYKPHRLYLDLFGQERISKDFVWELAVSFCKDEAAGGKTEKFLTSNNQHCELYHVHEDEQQGMCTVLKRPQYDDPE